MDLRDVIRYLLSYEQAYQLDRAARLAAAERDGKLVVSHDQVTLDDGSPGVQVFAVLDRRVLWTGPVDEWPDDPTWVHTDRLGDETFELAPPLAFGDLPEGLLHASMSG